MKSTKNTKDYSFRPHLGKKHPLPAFSSNVCEANNMARMPSFNESPFSTLESRMFHERPFLAMTCFRAQESSTRRTGRNALGKVGHILEGRTLRRHNYTGK